MAPSTDEIPHDFPSPTPYDLTTLQERIQREIIGISALSEFLAALGTQGSGPRSTEDPPPEGKVCEPPFAQPKMDMIRVRLDDDFWVDMTPEQVTGFLSRKEASLRAVEERRENLAQLQEWMIRELRDMGELAPSSINEESTDVQQSGESLSRTTSEATVPPDLAVTAKSTQTPNPAKSQSQPPTTTPHAPADPSTAITSHAPSSHPVVAKETIKQLEDINVALSKFGTSMEEVLKLDAATTATGGSGASMNGTEVGQDGTVLNEEGLPFHDIREDLPSASDERTRDVATTEARLDPLPVDDYWSEEAVERRRKLRESLFGTDDDDDEEDENEESDGDDNDEDRAREQQEETTASPIHPPPATKSIPSTAEAKSIPLPEPEIISPPVNTKGKGKAPARKPGFMARSIVIDHSTEKDDAEDEAVESRAPATKSIDSAVKGAKDAAPAKLTTALATPTTPLTETTETEPVVTSERRKSVTFNPQTRVRLYEKGEVMPNTASASVPAKSEPTSPSLSKSEPTSRFELLPDDAKSAPAPPVAAPSTKVVKPAEPTKARDSGVFSGFKKGFLEGAKSVKKTQPVTQVPAKPTAAPAVPTPTSPLKPTIVDSPEYHQPLAPVHEKPARSKKQSVFSQRKAVAQSKRDQLMNFSSFDPMPSGDPVGTGAIKTGAAPAAVNPMKMSVVEKATAPAIAPVQAKPTAGPIPTVPSVQQFPPNVKKQTAVKEAVMERKPPVVAPPSIDNNENSDPPDDDADSDSPAEDLEYSDGEDAFDMDEALLAREAALAYHAKRSALGRAGLGGWTGRFGPDGEVEWDTEIVPMSAGMEEAPPRTGAVAFGEQIIPVGMEGMRLPTSGQVEGDSSDDEGDEQGIGSISLPQVIPASEDLASAIKIGKLENGNLVVQDADDSDEEDEQNLNAVTPEQRAAQTQAAEEKRQRKAMIDRLRRGDVSEMIREERQRQEEFQRNGGGYVEPPKDAPPDLGSVSAESAAGKEAGKQAVGRDVVESSAIGSSAAREEPAKPKKVSRFKAARMAAS